MIGKIKTAYAEAAFGKASNRIIGVWVSAFVMQTPRHRMASVGYSLCSFSIWMILVSN